MASKIKDFFTSLWLTLVWTAGVAGVSYLIFQFLFRFDIFLASSWKSLPTAHLCRLRGLVFGILLIAMPAIYTATDRVIWRDRKPLIGLPNLKIKKQEDKKSESADKKTESEKEIILSKELPEKLHAQYNYKLYFGKMKFPSRTGATYSKDTKQ